MTANAAIPVISASPVHQQGMSPTPMVEGETRGPNYEQLPAEPLREEQGAGVQQRESPLPNGVSSVNLYGSGGASPAVGHGTSNVAVVADHPPRQLPVDGTEASLPTLPVERTGLRMSVLETTGSVRDDTPAASSTFSNVSSVSFARTVTGTFPSGVFKGLVCKAGRLHSENSGGMAYGGAPPSCAAKRMESE